MLPLLLLLASLVPLLGPAPPFAAAKHLWFEAAPAWDDRCTIVVKGLGMWERKNVHWPADCRNAGLLWLGTTGRIHAWQYVDLENKQEFMVCMTGGVAEQLNIWYDYAGNHLEPMTFPVWYMRPRLNETCKRSINGTMKLMFESPKYTFNYYTFVSLNVTLIDDYQPKPWPPEKPWTVAGQEEEEDEAEEEETVDDILADDDVEDGRFEYY